VKLLLESKLRLTDGATARLTDVVIDPRNETVTHVVVRGDRDSYETRLVPVDRVVATDGSEPGLRCTDAELDEYPMAAEVGFLRVGDSPVAEPEWAVGIQDVLALPHFDAEFGDGWNDDHYTVGWDRIPAGEVEIRRESVVTSHEGREVGHVDGFVCDEDGRVSHLVLQHGHLFGHRDVAIPIGSVERLSNDRVKVALSRDEIAALPQVTIHRWHLRR
jgi:sporulation protein YlmC with PRC-barrel domain